MPTATQPFVLLVEDSEDDAFFFERALEKSGLCCSLTHVTNGAKAIEFLQKASSSEEPNFPRAIFLDLKMPVVNGFEFLDWMRMQPFARSIQVIVLSGSEQENDRKRATGLGAGAYLVKPVRPAHLDELLRDALPREMGARA